MSDTEAKVDSLPEQAERAAQLLAKSPTLPDAERFAALEAVLKFQMDAILTLLRVAISTTDMTEEALHQIVTAVNAHSEAIKLLQEPPKKIITLDQLSR